MAGRSRSPRRSAQYAWLVTTPLALFALICAAVYWVLQPDWYLSWRGGLVALVALVVAYVGAINVVVRRQTFTLVATELPLVLAFFYLPPVMVILAAAAASLITQVRSGMVATKLWFNVAKSAASISAA